MKKIMTIVAVLALAALVGGCSKAPTEAVQTAELALQSVETAGAELYAPAALAAAKEAQAKLQAELTAQNEKMGLMRRYGTAGELAVAAKAAADAALAETEKAKQVAHDSAVARINETAALLETVRPMLANAPRGKGSEADLRLLEADLMSVEAALGEARTAVETGDYLGAEAKAAAAGQSVNEVKSAIEAAQAAAAQRTRR